MVFVCPNLSALCLSYLSSQVYNYIKIINSTLDINTPGWHIFNIFPIETNEKEKIIYKIVYKNEVKRPLCNFL